MRLPRTLFGEADRLARIAHALARAQAMTRAGIKTSSHKGFINRLEREGKLYRAYDEQRERIKA